MSEQQKDSSVEKTQDDELIRLTAVRYRRPEELELRRLKKQNNTLRTILIGLFIVTLGLAGFTTGYVLDSLKKPAPSVSYHVDEKFDRVMDIMQNDWYFGKDIENAEERFLDQAIIGMTTNEEDPHTAYMSRKEVEEFFQSINRNFVGIGVQFIATDTMNIIKRVFPETPAAEAGVLPGDMIYSVDGVSVEQKSSSEIVDMVRGEEGDPVHIVFIRGDEKIEFDIVRREITVTVLGEMLDDDLGYVEIMQFGDTTGKELDACLKQFVSAGAKGLVIDLRGNGGGYLSSLQEVAGLFLGKDVPVIREEQVSGVVEELETTTHKVWNDTPIVLLVDNLTASAAEAFTLAMREQYPQIHVIGGKTYGKGTVQITRSFTDGSALKYTTARWLSPNNVCINQEGIEPDETVESHPIMTESYFLMEDGEVLEPDCVDSCVHTMQLCLDYLGYEVDRTDGYFSEGTKNVILQFQKDLDLKATGNLDQGTYQTAISEVMIDANTNLASDNQLVRAREILHG